MEKNSSLAAYVASVTTVLTLQDLAMVVGILTALGTFVVNWYYKAREDARAEAKDAVD